MAESVCHSCPVKDWRPEHTENFWKSTVRNNSPIGISPKRTYGKRAAHVVSRWGVPFRTMVRYSYPPLKHLLWDTVTQACGAEWPRLNPHMLPLAGMTAELCSHPGRLQGASGNWSTHLPWDQHSHSTQRPLSSGSQSGQLPPGTLTKIWRHFGCHNWVGVLLASGTLRPGMLASILQCIE